LIVSGPWSFFGYSDFMFLMAFTTWVDDTEALALGEVAWASRPTFTFTPQRGADFAHRMTSPLPPSVVAELMAAEWDASVPFRLLVRNANGLQNALGMVNDDSIEMADLNAGWLQSIRKTSPTVR